MGIIIGGVVPALFIGVALTLLKLSGSMGINAGTGMMFTAVGVFISGAAAHFLGLSSGFTLGSSSISVLVGVFWGAGTLLMSFAVSKLGISMPVSASLAAANILVVLVLGLIFFRDGVSLDILKATIGALLIVGGSVLVTLA